LKILRATRRFFVGGLTATFLSAWTHGGGGGGGGGGNFLVTETGAFLVDQSGNNLIWS
jgi:hypothetical protein